MKKLLATMLALVMALTLCATAWAEGENATSVFDENGVASVTDAQEFTNAIEEILTGKATGAVTVDIRNDIDGSTLKTVQLVAYGSLELTIKGNGNKITGLKDMLFSKVGSIKAITIENLTIEGANIQGGHSSDYNYCVGAFVGELEAVNTANFNGCCLANSTINDGDPAGGLVGMAIGPYDGSTSTVTFVNCSVTGNTIKGQGSAGGLIGHGIASATVSVSVENAVVTGNKISSAEGATKVGSVFGTVGNFANKNITISATVSGNAATSGENTVTTIYGRGLNGVTLTIAGGSYDNLPLNPNDQWASVATGVAGAKVTVDNKATYIYGAEAINAVAKPGATIEVLNGSVTIDGETYDVGKTVTILNKYTVTFDSNGGSAVDAQTVKDGAMATEPTAPTKTGYTFAGWFAKDATTAFDFAKTTVTADTTLTAKWDAKKSTATISTGSGSTTAGSQNITAGQEFTLEEKNTVAGSNTPTTSATFNGTAASVIVEGANDATELNLTVVAAAGTNDKNVADENKAAYEAATENATSTANAVVVSIDLKAITNDTVTPLFTEAVDGAYAIVKVPYKTGMKADSVTVTHLDTNGQTTVLTRSASAELTENNSFYYDSTTGVITLRLPHFSQYLINAEKASSGGHARPILSGGATAADTVKDKAESPKTFDAGIAIYGVMAISSVLGMGYVGKKKF